jgi:hypothetical protein
MTVDPRAALANLSATLERHLEASAQRRGENDPSVVAAFQDVADAFELYDDALLEAYGEVTPLEIYYGDDDEEDPDEVDDTDDEDPDELVDTDEDDPDELDDTDDEDDGVYLGLDDSEYDEEPSTTR